MTKLKELLITPQQAAEIMGVPLRGIHEIMRDFGVEKHWQGKHSRYRLKDALRVGKDIEGKLKEFDRFINRHSLEVKNEG